MVTEIPWSSLAIRVENGILAAVQVSNGSDNSLASLIIDQPSNWLGLPISKETMQGHLRGYLYRQCRKLNLIVAKNASPVEQISTVFQALGHLKRGHLDLRPCIFLCREIDGSAQQRDHALEARGEGVVFAQQLQKELPGHPLQQTLEKVINDLKTPSPIKDRTSLIRAIMRSL